MKWKEYTKLNKAQKEEYDFRFKCQKIEIHAVPAPIVILAGIQLFIAMVIMMSLLLVHFSEQVGVDAREKGILLDGIAALLGFHHRFMLATMMVWLVIATLFVVQAIYNHMIERRWYNNAIGKHKPLRDYPPL